MFFLDEQRTQVVLSPSDLRLASVCEFALVRDLDVRLKGVTLPEEAPDPMAQRIIKLGNHHEQRELLRLSREHPGKVVQFARPDYTASGLQAAQERTLAALASDAEVVVQATFFDGGFVGHADFLERTDEGWLVCDTKLARSDSVPALLQISAYAACLRDEGVPTAPVARLLLGSGVASDHPLTDLLPVYRARRRRLESLVAEHRATDAEASWGDPRWLACGSCPTCVAACEEARDVLLVAGVRMPTRRHLRDAGVMTIEDLASRVEPVPEVRESQLARLRAQATLQLRQDNDPQGQVFSEVTDARALHALPSPSPGDVFFDFEGDPLWSERGSKDWGLEYLFGMVEVDHLPNIVGTFDDNAEEPRFRAFWAHDREGERQALIDFVAYLTQRRLQWPDLHVYHFADYERAALLRLAARHAVCEEEIDQFLRDGVFVDLYPVVKSGIRVSQRSYSIKKLEPLYMPKREIELQSGGDSIVVYHEFCAAEEVGDKASAKAKLDEIRAYNRDDCLSTWLLRNWLLRQGDVQSGPLVGAPVAEAGWHEATPAKTPSAARDAAAALEAALRGLLPSGRSGEPTPEEQALSMTASSIQFHVREDKPFWWGHFDRLRVPVQEWMKQEGVFVVTAVEEAEWIPPQGRQKVGRRRLRLTGHPLAEQPFPDAGTPYAIYEDPTPASLPTEPGCRHSAHRGVTVVESSMTTDADGHLTQEVVIEETHPRDGEPWPETPIALTPPPPFPTNSIDNALNDLAEEVQSAWPTLPPRVSTDLLLRRAPRLHGDAHLPQANEGTVVEAITEALLRLDHSYLAVQGPPGTGKTYVGARVIRSLVEDHGWKVGVCAQSHAAVENVLTAVVNAGLPAGQVAKAVKHEKDPNFTALQDSKLLPQFIQGQRGGYVIGGTAWDLTNLTRVERDQLDLVVIDEAGQFSLAKTLAVSTAGSRMLLLGDPQQLPQVSNGSHPDPVDLSALGWLIGDDAVLPPTMGYFLDTTWRMHPALTEPVSNLSYAGQLHSRADITAARSLTGVQPGLHLRLVEHRDNARTSPEEAAVVVALVSDLVGRDWDAPDEAGATGPRPLRPRDLIVTTPYNAQADTLSRALADAGYPDVPVGTVDKFQGREAAVAIVSMAASAPGDVSRGLGFLLDRNRLNVAVSRGKHAAYLVCSNVLTDIAPRSTSELLALGAFIGLCEAAVETVRVPAPLEVASTPLTTRN